MKVSRILSTLLLGATLSCAIELQEMPEVKNRVMPEVSANTVFSFYESIKDAKLGVVNISTEKKVKSNFRMQQNPLFNDPLFNQFFGDMFGQMIPKDRVERSLGSGVIISEDGYIITNNHVIDGADSVIVNLPNSSKEYKAKVIGKDPKSDIAVIKIEEKNLKPLKFAKSEELKVGDIVFAIGNPFGVGETVTQGIVSALNKSGIGINDYENFIQTDASINPGNSGGALVDTRGALIGINTAILSKTGGNHGVGFAIPSDMVKKIALQLVNKGKIDRGFMGVSIQNVTEDYKDFYGRNEGAIITAINKDSPAEKSGLKIWDLIISIEGKEVKDSSDLKNKIGSFQPKDKIKVSYIRDKKEYTTIMTLEALDGDGTGVANVIGGSGAGIEGLFLQDIDNNLVLKYRLPKNLNGVVVVGVQNDSEADSIGFEEGDLIMQIESYKIEKTQDFKSAIQKLGKNPKRVLINRRGNTFTMILR